MAYEIFHSFEELFAIPLRNGLTRPKAVRGAGVKMVNMGEIFAYSRISNIPMDRVPLSEKEAEKNLLKPGDLLFARQSLVLSGAGKCSIFLGDSEEVTFESHLIRARLNQKIADPEFYYYFFNSIVGRQLIEGIVEQVAAAGIRGTDLAKLEVPHPPLPEQRTIAHILGTLDDKIELNQQMNRELEAIARAIFKSWFVDFDPVHAKMEGRQPAGMDAETAVLFPDSFEESYLGEIPKGWGVGTLGKVVGVNERSIRKDYSYQTLNYVDISSVTEGRLEGTTSYTLSKSPSRAKRLVKHGDTIWSTVRPNRKSYLFIYEPDENLVVSTGFAVLTPLLIPPSYLYAWVTTVKFVDYLAYNADGSAYPAVLPNRFSDATILLPSVQVLQEFEKQVGAMREKIAHNERESRTLAAIRDSLLPKLMSGEIRVKDAEKLVEAAE